jgi:hypothetical protein
MTKFITKARRRLEETSVPSNASGNQTLESFFIDEIERMKKKIDPKTFARPKGRRK